MTDQRLRELLDERVADLTSVDLGQAAWQQARAVRHRRRAVAAVAAGVAAIVGTTAVVVSGGDDGAAPPAFATPSHVVRPSDTVTPSGGGAKAVRAGEYAGAHVWWAPRTEAEAGLPTLEGTALPAEIDLSDGRPAWPGGMRAVAVLQLWGDEPGGVVVVGEDGTSYSLDVSRLDPVRAGDGTDVPPLSQDSLSADGRYVSFRQPASLEIYDFESRRWTRDPSVEIRDRPGRYPGSRVGDEPYGPIKRYGGAGARGMFVTGPITDPSGAEVRSVDALGAGGETEPGALLAFPNNRADDGRWLQCCPPVGWLDADTVLFESRWAGARILAWRVDTPDVYQVSEIRGWTPGDETYVASFAALD